MEAAIWASISLLLGLAIGLAAAKSWFDIDRRYIKNMADIDLKYVRSIRTIERGYLLGILERALELNNDTDAPLVALWLNTAISKLDEVPYDERPDNPVIGRRA